MLPDLAAFHDRLVADGVLPPFGFERRPIAFELVIDAAGRLVAIVDTRSREALQGRLRIVPTAVRRSGTRPAPNMLWDYADFVLGASLASGSSASDPPAERHARFTAQMHRICEAAADEGLAAVVAFLDNDPLMQAAAFEETARMIAGAWTVSFKLHGDDGLVCERPGVRDHLARIAAVGDDAWFGRCLVTGRDGPIERVHPIVRGLPGAHPTGAALVSFNLDATRSHGLSQGGNAPISKTVAAGCADGLSYLLTAAETAGCRITLPGGVVLVAWDDVGGQIAGQLREWLAPTYGKPRSPPLNTTDGHGRVHLAILSANVARVVVRFSTAMETPVLLEMMQRHARDLGPPPPGWSLQPLPRIAQALAGRGAELPAPLAADLVLAAVTGRPLSLPLILRTLAVCRSEAAVPGPLASLLSYAVARRPIGTASAAPSWARGRLTALLIKLLRETRTSPVVLAHLFRTALDRPAVLITQVPVIVDRHVRILRAAGRPRRAHWLSAMAGRLVARSGAPQDGTALDDRILFLLGFHHQMFSRSQPLSAPIEPGS